MGEVFFGLLWLIVLLLMGLSFYLPFRFRREWEGMWKNIALLPLAIQLFAVINIVAGILIDPTSHNLFPFEIIIACIASLLSSLLIVLIHRFTRRAR